MKKLIFLIGLLMVIAPSVAVCGAMPQGDYPILAQQSQGGPQTQSQPMTRSQDWPNMQGSGPPYGTSTQQSTTPGYPRPQKEEGMPYGAPVTPEKQRQQGGSDMGSQGWPNVQGPGPPYGTPSQKSATPGYPPRQSEGDNIATPQGPGQHSGEIAPGGAGTPYGTPSQKSTTPGYPMKQQEGDPYATPGTPAERSQQGGSQSR